MIFFKTSRSLLNISQKSKKVKRSISHFFKSRPAIHESSGYSSYTNAVFASTALVGLTAYIIYKRSVLLENLDTLDVKHLNDEHNKLYDEAIRKSRELLQRVKDECGAPGMVVGVSINGEIVWTEGLGYSDLENRVLCSSNTVMRIASISKSITMAAVAKLWEQGKLNLDKPVQHYVPHFPSKTFDGKPVTITCRQLVSHLGGIRHYDKNAHLSAQNKNGEKVNGENAKKNGIDMKELHSREYYKDVKSALDLFKDDPLVANPGSKYLYSTHGWTLISAIVESAAKEPFAVHMTKLFKSLGMHSTYLDRNDALIYHRSKNYVKDKRGYIINAPYVDNSYKWAGGGFLSTVGDLLQFGNAMLYSFQYETIAKLQRSIDDLNNKEANKRTHVSTKSLPGYLKSKTLQEMWTPVTDTKEGKYGMGWAVLPEINQCQFCESTKFSVYHTGGAIGASSVLLMMPLPSNEINDLNNPAPAGIIVAIITNLSAVCLSKTAYKIAECFRDQLKSDLKYKPVWNEKIFLN